MIFIALWVRSKYAQVLPTTWIASRVIHVETAVEMNASHRSRSNEIKIVHSSSIYKQNTQKIHP